MGSDFAPFTSPYLKALKMQEFRQDLEARKEQRDMSRQRFLMDIEDRKRRQAIEDFQTGMALDASGLLPVEPGIVGKFRAGIGGRGTVEAPGFGQRSVPTPAQRQEQAYGAARSKGVSEGITARTKEDIVNPMTDVQVETGLPGPFSTATKTVREKDVAKTREDAFKRAYPDLVWTRGNDGKGNMTLVGNDPKTGQQKVRQVLQGIVASSAEKMEKPDDEAAVLAESDQSAERIKRMDDMRSSVYQRLGLTVGDVSSEEAARAEKYLGDVVDTAMKADFNRAVAQRKVGRGQAARPDLFARKTTLKIGDKRTVRGKLMTITKVYPDGTFDAN